MYKYGILSTASIIDRFIGGIRDSKQGEVYAIASRTVEKAKEAADRLNINVCYGSYEELFEDENIDIIYVPTVNSLHYRDVKNALMHHKHVVCEKPFTLTKQESVELFELAKKNNCFLMEGQKCIFLPVNKHVKEMIQNEKVGKIKYVDLQAGFPARFNYDHWMYDLSYGGGSFYGSAAYTLDYMQYLFDSHDLKINGSCLVCPTGSDELSHFEVVVNEDIMVSSTIAMNIPLKNKAVFYGDKGYIEVDQYWKSRYFDVYLYDGTHEHYEYPCVYEFVYEIDHVHDCLNQSLLTSPVIKPEITIKTVELVEELYNKWNLK